MSRLALRAGVVADAAAIASVFTRSRQLLSFLPNLYSADEDFAFWRDHVLPKEQVTVALLDDRIVGVLAADDLFVDHLYVDPSCVGQGVGTVLLMDIQAQRDQLQLWCFEQNTGARRFYEQHGFVGVETTDGSGNEEKCRDIRYLWQRHHPASS